MKKKEKNPYSKPDFYSQKAKEEGYLARSVYKLKEINEKFKLIKKGQNILDLGCAPGSWSQYISKIINPGIIVGIDIKDCHFSDENFIFIKGDFEKEDNKILIKEKIDNKKFDGIVSDMAPDTEGDDNIDRFRSSQLVENALEFCFDNLKKDGFFIAKIFQGGDEKEVMNKIKFFFKEAKWFKPKSCRQNSVEIYIVASGFNNKNIKENKEERDFLKELEENYTGEMSW